MTVTLVGQHFKETLNAAATCPQGAHLFALFGYGYIVAVTMYFNRTSEARVRAPLRQGTLESGRKGTPPTPIVLLRLLLEPLGRELLIRSIISTAIVLSPKILTEVASLKNIPSAP